MNSQPSTLIVQMMGLPKIQLIMNNLIVTLWFVESQSRGKDSGVRG